MAQLLSTVNKWIASTRKRIAKEVHAPLINDTGLPMGTLLEDAWGSGDQELYEAVENVLSRDPEDLATRFVALNTFYRLMTLRDNTEDGEESKEPSRKDFQNRLAYFVRLRDANPSSSLVDIRWEIVSACAVRDFGRALSYCEQLKQSLPHNEFDYLCGRLHFLIALGDTHLLSDWDLPIGPHTADYLRNFVLQMRTFYLYTLGLNSGLATIATEEDGNHLRDAIKHLDKASVLSSSRPSARFMVARSRSEVGEYPQAAEHYLWLLDHREAVLKDCDFELQALSQQSLDLYRADVKDFVPRLYDCLVDNYSKGGETEKAIDAAKCSIRDCGDGSETYVRMSELHAQKSDYRAAYESLRKAVDINPVLGEDSRYSIALALGSIAKFENSDAIAARIALDIQEKRPTEHGQIKGLLLEYWPTYEQLSEDCKDQWATAELVFRGASFPGCVDFGCNRCAWAVEHELQRRIVGGFRLAMPTELQNRSDEDDEMLTKVFRPREYLTFGQLINTVINNRRSRGPMRKSFDDWLTKEYPRLKNGLNLQPLIKIIGLRNRAIHPMPGSRPITPQEAAKMLRACRNILDLLATKVGR